MRTTDPAALALAKLIDSTHYMTRTAKISNMPASTLWHRANGRPSKEENL